MNNLELQKLVGIGVSVIGLLAAGKAFTAQADTVERKGLNLLTVALLIGAGVTLVVRIEDSANDIRGLLG